MKIINILVFQLFLGFCYGLYCNDKNCYDLLEIPQTATHQQIKKAFRKQALKYHPDKVKQQDTTQIFQQINQAYEILENEFTRKQYDLYLRDPNQLKLSQYYRYYKAFYMPQTNPLVVIFIFLLLLSLLQFVMRKAMYETAIKNIMATDLFKRTVNERWDGNQDKDELRQEIKNQICLAGGHSKPLVRNLLIIRLLVLPYTLCVWIYGVIRWTYRYRIMKYQYLSEQYQLLTIKALGLSDSRWHSLDQTLQKSLIQRKLWIKANLIVFQQEQRKASEEQMKGSNKYKKYIRFMKKHN